MADKEEGDDPSDGYQIVKAASIVNLCPHDIKVYLKDKKKIICFPATGIVVRAYSEPQPVIEVLPNGIEVVAKPKYIGIDPATWPADAETVIGKKPILVSDTAAEILAAKYPNVIYVPDTNQSVRDKKGAIVGVEALVRYSEMK